MKENGIYGVYYHSNYHDARYHLHMNIVYGFTEEMLSTESPPRFFLAHFLLTPHLISITEFALNLHFWLPQAGCCNTN